MLGTIEPAAPGAAADPAAGGLPTGAPKAGEVVQGAGAALKMPEGIVLPAGHTDALATWAKDHGIVDPAAQQALLDRDAQLMQAQVTFQEATWAQRVGEMKQALVNDPEIGGANYRQTDLYITRALRDPKFGSPQLEAMLLETGFIYEPVVARHLRAIGLSMSETPPIGGAPAPAGESTRATLFANSPGMDRK